MVGGMRDNTMRIRNKDKVLILGLMAKSILVDGKMVFKKVRGNLQTPNYKEEVEPGYLEKELLG
jgi:hypothetical protein